MNIDLPNARVVADNPPASDDPFKPRTTATQTGHSIAFTISVRTPQGRLLVDITWEALRKLHRPAHEPTLLTTLSRHTPTFHAVAMRLAAFHAISRITIDTHHVDWYGDDVD